MGFLKGLISDAIGEGVRKAVGGAVESAVGKVVQPAADNLANKAAKNMNESAAILEEAGKSMSEACISMSEKGELLSKLENFPMWEYSPITDYFTDEVEGYDLITVSFKMVSEDIVGKYIKDLEKAGFTGDWQIQRKKINGKEYVADFTFFFDGEDASINYLISK